MSDRSEPGETGGGHVHEPTPIQLGGGEDFESVPKIDTPQNAETAVEDLEKQFGTLKNGEVKTKPVNIEGDDNTEQSTCKKDFIEHYNCIYVSPIYDDKKGNIDKTQIAEHNNEMQNEVLNNSISDDDQELEIKRLRAELQRRRLQHIEEEKNTIADKFIDKIDTTKRPTTSRVRRYHEEIQAFKADQNTGTSSCESPENPCGSMNRHKDRPYFEGPACENLVERFSANEGYQNVIQEKEEMDNRENGESLSAVPELNRSAQNPEWLKSDNEVQETIGAFLATMQVSVENLCSSFKIYDASDDDSSKICSGAVEDELFILKKTLCKLVEMCHESGYQYKAGMEYLDIDNLGQDHHTVDGVIGLVQSDSKVTALDSLCIQKGREVEDLESKIYALWKEAEAFKMEKCALTITIQKMTKEAEKQKHQIEELLSINNDLLDFSQAKEDQLAIVQEEKDHLMQQLVQCEENFIAIESALIEKDEGMEEMNRKLKAARIGTDAIIIEKIELMAKFQAVQKEAEEQKCRMVELVGINKDLLEFAQNKEDQLGFLYKEVQRLQSQTGENGEETNILAPDLQGRSADLKDLLERKRRQHANSSEENTRLAQSRIQNVCRDEAQAS